MVETAYEAHGGSGAALVLLHGIGGDASCWRPQLAAFGRRFRAIAWDLPGWGRSPPLPEMTMPALARALIGLLDRLAIEAAHVVGHSLGGMVAQELVATTPQRARSLTLVATSAAFGRPAGQWQTQFVARRLAPLDRGLTMADLAPELVRGLVGEGADREGVALATAAMARVPEATYRAAIRCLVSFDRRDALARIPVPTLLVAGERDPAAPAAMMARMAARIPGARLVALPACGHLANLEQPAAFNRALGGFLDGLGGEPRP